MNKIKNLSVLALLGLICAQNVAAQCNNKTFIVIGAGIAGLGAANYLR